MRNGFAKLATALASGLVFGLGLSISGMLDPVRVQGFLDLFGSWDPSLAFVLGGAVVVAFAGVVVSRRLHRPAFDTAFHLPETRLIDRPLVIGSALFAIAFGKVEVVAFIVAMLAGMMIHDRSAGRTR